MNRFFSWLLLPGVAFGCGEKEETTTIFKIPEELAPYVDTFFSEAIKRGLQADRTNLIIEFGDITEAFLCAGCNSASSDPRLQKIIVIDNALKCWNNNEELEALIFHEMGHCILGRLHNDNLLPNGDPVSLMVSNSISMYAPCLYPINNDPCNNTFKRAYYLDELFNPDTPVPAWADD